MIQNLEGRPVHFLSADGVLLGGHFWAAGRGTAVGNVIINPATGVLARYYHRYARFLAGHGFNVLAYDYRGIGQSRQSRLKGSGFRWRDWGEQDFDAALRFMRDQNRDVPLIVVGHSIGGFLPGLSQNGHLIDRMLTIGAQYAWWGDYARRRRLRLLLKWHLAMPALTAICGYFPGRWLGWLEDLPAGVANEWSFRGPRFERSHPRAERQDAVRRMTYVRAPILAIVVSDDELGTMAAVQRTLGYYTGAKRTAVLLTPANYGRDEIGHFSLFHDNHAAGFWLDTLLWLRDGRNPWPDQNIGTEASLAISGSPQSTAISRPA